MHFKGLLFALVLLVPTAACPYLRGERDLQNTDDTQDPGEETFNDDAELGQTITTAPADPPGSSPTPGSNCFSSRVPVDVAGRGRIPMSELRVGDKILSGNGATYQEVYAFAHRDENAETTFLQIKTQLGGEIEVTSDHLVFVHHQNQEDDSSSTLPVPAGTISVGDRLLHAGPDGRTKLAQVLDIRIISRKGLYAPLTGDGTFLANGLAVSAYVTLQPASTSSSQSSSSKIRGQNDWTPGITHHLLSQMALTPFRVVCLSLTCESTEEETMPRYVAGALQAASASERFPLLAQKMVFVVFLLLVGPLWVLELALGPSGAFLIPALLPFAIVTALVLKRFKFHFEFTKRKVA